MSDSYTRLVAELHEVRRRWRRKLLAAGLLGTAAAAAVALLVTVLADNLWRLDPAGRLVLALVFWATMAGALVWLVARRGWESRRDDFFAALVEQRHPELHNLLVNALQLGRGSPHGSPRLIAAIINDAATATADLDLGDCLDTRPIKRAALLVAGGAVLLVAYAVVAPARFGNGLARVLFPLAHIAPYTTTQVIESSVTPGNARVAEGTALTIEARVSGVVPDTARLLRRATGQPWQAAAMSPGPGARAAFQFTVSPARESFDYQVAAGDGRSLPYHIEVVKRPQIARLGLTETPPPYTARPPRAVPNANGEIAGLAGTTVALEVNATKPLREATVVTEGEHGQAIPLAKAADDRTWRGVFVLWTSDAHPATAVAGQRLLTPTRYAVRLLDTEGYENSAPLWHPITPVSDQAPTVAITAPARDLQLRAAEILTLVVEAKDDYGLGELQILGRVNDEPSPRVLAGFPHAGPPRLQTRDSLVWKLADLKVKPGDLIQYWAVATDRNEVTGPGRAESRRFSIFIVAPQEAVARIDTQISDYAQVLEELLRLQGENRAQTAGGVSFETLVGRQVKVRVLSDRLARAMERGAVPLQTMIQALDDLAAGLLAEAVHLLEGGRDTKDADRAAKLRAQSLPVQDRIISQLQALLARLQRNEQARDALRKLAKTDTASHQAITDALAGMLKDLDRMLREEKQLATKFEKLPKHAADATNQEALEALKDLAALPTKWGQWAAGKVDELTKLPTGFVDDFGLRPDVKRLFEEIEAAKRQAAVKAVVALEDLGASLATKMKEDLEVWMPDLADNVKWIQEEPLDMKPMNIPEMPLPDSLEDMVGDLLQQEEDFDEEADDVTSAWGDNLDQAGWGVADGAISIFAAKGKTGNDLPNSNELSGRSGDGRRGKSSGQMVGDTSHGRAGRKTLARVTAERYEPGVLKSEAAQDPNGSTGGGKKAGAGQRGLQGGTPPDFVKDMHRLAGQQALIREKAEHLAQRLAVTGASSRRLTESIELMKSIEGDYRDLRYDDAARKRRVALGLLNNTLADLDQPTGVALSRARELPAALREELRQAADEGYPAGYEDLLKNYYRALSETEK